VLQAEPLIAFVSVVISRGGEKDVPPSCETVT
jgi:hypothetical protein